MADLAITYTFVANTLAKASEVNQNFTDGKNYINARNQGTTGWDFITLASSGLLKLPTGDSATAPALTYTGDTNTGQFYVAADTIGWTTGGTERLRLSTSILQSALPVTITPTSNQIVLGTTNTMTINATAPSTSRILTIPDPGATASFVMTEGSQTINGTKTLSSFSGTLASNLAAAGFKLTGLGAGTSSGDSVRYEDVVRLADAQTITGQKTFSQPTLHADGTVSLPGVAFSADTDTGLYRTASNTIGFTTNGTLKWTIDGAGDIVVQAALGHIFNAEGTATTPAYSFNSDQDTGMYLVSANNLGFATSGSIRWTMDSASALVGNNTAARIYNGDGSVATPAYNFNADQDTGLYRISADTIGIATNGTLRATINNSGLALANLTASTVPYADSSKILVSSAVTPTELGYLSGVTSAIQTQINDKASTALSNLASVAINTTLVSDTDNTDDLGTSTINWKDLYLKGDVKVGSTTAIDLASTAAVSIRGTNTNDSAASGFVGEYVSSSSATAIAAGTSGQFKDFVSISLTAGDWDVSGILQLAVNGATLTDWAAAISINSNNTTTDHVRGDNVQVIVSTFGTGDQASTSIPTYRLSLTATTTVYLKLMATYSAGTPNIRAGRISARRVR